jgi:hypothetical protein
MPTETQLARQQEPTVMEILSQAVMSGQVSVDVIERLTALQRQQVEYQAKVEFNEAMHRAQTKMRAISTDAVNPQTKSRYASYNQLDKSLRPLYTDEGFSLSFNTADSPLPDHMRVTCDVSRGGHVKLYQIDIPNDGKGAKGGDVMTKTHATGAGTSYGMRYLLKMIFNVAVGEDDDDGNSGSGLPDPDFCALRDNIEAAESEAELTRYYKEAFLAAEKINDWKSIEKFKAAKDAQKAKLSR